MQRHFYIGLTRLLPVGLAVAALVALFAVGVTAATLPACTSCHGSDPLAEETEASSHSEIRCVRCHVAPGVASRLTFGSRQLFGMTLRFVPVGGRAIASVPDATCLSCHEQVLGEVSSSKGLRIAHVTCAVGRTCGDCHSGTAHGSAVAWLRIAEMEKCLECHGTGEVSADCGKCHDPRTQRERLGVGAWRVTHGAEWETTHGMGNSDTCAACHPSNYCARCHGIDLPHEAGFLESHGQTAKESPSSCGTCHRRNFCDDCHGLEMPHPAEFTPAHSAIASGTADVVCATCHVASDCSGCHVKHVHPGGAIGGAPAGTLPGGGL